MKRPDLLLLHGALGDGSQMTALRDICMPFFNVHVVSFRGHGDKSLTGDSFLMDDFVEDVIAYLDQNNLVNILIFGYSMGGYAGLKLAAAHPERVVGLVTLGTKLDWSPESAARESAMLNPEIMEQKIPAFTGLLEKRHTAIGWKKLVTKTAEMMTNLGKIHLTDEQFGKINVPVQLMVGEKDKMVSLAETEKVAGLIPAAKLRVLENVPHPFEQVAPDLIANELRMFSENLSI